jgi:putative DNA primase/helicase
MSTTNLQPHRKDDNLTSGLSFPYQPGKFPEITRWLIRTIPDESGRQAYMAHIGLALRGDTKFHQALVLIGPPRSGKTTALVLAQMATGQRPFQFAGEIVFDPGSHGADSRSQWRTNPLVCLDEWPENALRDSRGEDILKTMIAHGGATMKKLYRSEEKQNQWTSKLIFATNNIPRFRDSSGALMRRLVFIRCPNGLPDKALDRDLLMQFQAELAAFVPVCLEEAARTLEENKYPESAEMLEFKQTVETSGDAVKLWVHDYCILESGTRTPTGEMYSVYQEFCFTNGQNPLSRPNLVIALQNRYSIPEKYTKIDGKSARILVGIRLRRPYEDVE